MRTISTRRPQVFPAGSGRCSRDRDDPGRRDPRQCQKALQRRLRIAGSRHHVYGDLWHHGGFLSGCGGLVYAQCGCSAGSSAGQLYGWKMLQPWAALRWGRCGSPVGAFAAVTAVFVWMITAGASRLKASKTLPVWPRQQKALTAKGPAAGSRGREKGPCPQAGAQIHPQWLAECMGDEKAEKALPDC